MSTLFLFVKKIEKVIFWEKNGQEKTGMSKGQTKPLDTPVPNKLYEERKIFHKGSQGDKNIFFYIYNQKLFQVGFVKRFC